MELRCKKIATIAPILLIIVMLAIALVIARLSSLNNTSALSNEINDENLSQCIIDEYNSQNETTYTNINELNLNYIEELRCNDRGIHNLDGISILENLNYFEVKNNYLESIEPVLELNNLHFLSVYGNHLNTSPLRSFDENSLSTIEAALQKNIIIEGIDTQALDYNQELANDKPKLHVLFVYVVNIDSDYINNGETKHYQHTLTNTEVRYFDTIRQQFEQTVEKLSNYRFDIVTDTYYTTETYAFSGWEGNYWLTASEIDEINDIRNDYDTVIVNAFYGNGIPHDASGLGNRGEAMVYYREDDDSRYNDAILKIQNSIIDDYVPSLVHEFIHSIEIYGYYTNQNIWEWHTATAYYSTIFQRKYGVYFNNQEFTSESLYLQGADNPEDPEETGITDAIIHLPYSRLLKNQNDDVISSVDSLSLLINDQEQLYAISRLPEKIWNKEWYAFYSLNDIEWRSIDQNIAIVDDNGLVTAINSGKTNIIAKSKDNDAVAIIEVEVGDNSSEPESQTFVLSFDTNGGINGPARQYCTTTGINTSCNIAIDSNTPTREGYTFLGWNDVQTGQLYQANDNIILERNTTLKAIWRVNSNIPDDSEEHPKTPNTGTGYQLDNSTITASCVPLTNY